MANIFISNNDITNEQVNLTVDEYDDRYVIYGRIPGVANNPINITFENDHIKITYTRCVAQSIGNQFSYVNIQQSTTENKVFYIPNVEPTKLIGTLENEMLSIIIPKKLECEDVEFDIIDIFDVVDV